jgi:hypothetical protein
MRALLYVTIWASMVALGLAEWAQRRPSRWAGRPTFLLSAGGLALLVTHIAIAIFHHHGGDHAAAVADTARLTESVYGVAWGGGVYVNYALVATWAAYLWWWRRNPGCQVDPRVPSVLALRLVLFVIIANALVIFASPLTRPLGVVICGALLWAWRPTITNQAPGTRHLAPGSARGTDLADARQRSWR